MGVRPILALWHDDCLLHDTGSGLFEGGPSPLLAVPELHPENAERLRNVRSAIDRGPLAEDVEWREAPLATDAELHAVHPPEHIASVEALARGRWRACYVEGSTFACAATPRAARRSAGAALAAADAAAGAEAAIAYACTRPPGHHAGPATIDGYCFYNGRALAAQRLRDHGAARVAVVDWDVHHGNGTQACFWERRDVLAISVHMDHRSWGPNHPEDGRDHRARRRRRARRDAQRAAAVRVRRPRRTPTRSTRSCCRRCGEFVPEAIVCAAGTDASQFDPNGRMCVAGRASTRSATAMPARPTSSGSARSRSSQEGGYARTYGAVRDRRDAARPARAAERPSRIRSRTCRTRATRTCARVAAARAAWEDGPPADRARHASLRRDACTARAMDDRRATSRRWDWRPPPA